MYLFTKPPSVLALTIILAVAAALISSADDAKDRQECAQSLAGLATCLPYVGGTAKSPTPDCCAGLKQLLNTNKKCLCLVIKDKDDPDLGLKINVTLALGLPRVCNAAAPNISHCPVLLGLPPNSSEAQMFYQLGNNSWSSGNISPFAGAPTPTTSIRNPTTAPLQGAAPHHKNGATNTMSSYLTPLWLCAFTVFYIRTSSFY